MSWQAVVFWLFFAFYFVSYLLYLHKVSPEEGKNYSVSMMSEDAIIIAIIVVMGFIPQLGYISVVPGISLTLMHLPVLLGAYRGGWKRGILYGFAFGITSCLQAIQNNVGLNAFFIYPWISVLPRVLFAFFAGLSFSFFKKGNKLSHDGLLLSAISFALTLLHTGLVFADLFLFYPSEMVSFFSNSSVIGNGIVLGVTLILILGCLGEATLAALFTPIVGKALDKINRK